MSGSSISFVDLGDGCKCSIDVAQASLVPSFFLRRNRGRMNVVTVEDRFTPGWLKFYEEYIMDNQKPNDGSARDVGREGSGSSMGKDTGTSRSAGTGGAGSTGSTGSTSGADMARDMAKDTSKDMSKSASDLHKTIDKAAEAAQPVVDRLASSAHAGVDKVSGALAGASKTMDEKSRQLADAYRNFADTGREYVRSSPATSVLVALGAGFILSKLLSSRR
jgi:ElaB/YqjD/DUF883 family membrane-anchored ribosome-binding protein